MPEEVVKQGTVGPDQELTQIEEHSERVDRELRSARLRGNIWAGLSMGTLVTGIIATSSTVGQKAIEATTSGEGWAYTGATIAALGLSSAAAWGLNKLGAPAQERVEELRAEQAEVVAERTGYWKRRMNPPRKG
ncbi:MAG: hypothetical protein GF414_00790 [Candidatus Altiarchaeales archaeon]|nr:hypothetical protein [Candidatus Altiarchaeales archaeon]